MRLNINTADGKPIYRQLIEQISLLVAMGQLKPGDELPPVRILAQELLINPNTVARAYRELEQAGLLELRQGAGSYVSNAGSPLARKERKKRLLTRVDALLAEASHLAFSLDEVLELVRTRNEEFRHPERSTNDDSND